MKLYHLLLLLTLCVCLIQCGKYQPTLDLHEAVRSGSVLSVRQALLAGADINAKNKEGLTALDLSLYQRSTDIFELLIEYDADVKQSHEILTSLLFSNKMELFETVLKKGAYVDGVIVSMTWNPNNFKADKTELVKLLLEHGTTKDNSPQTLKNQLMNFSAFMGDRYLIKLLRDEGAELYPGYLMEDELAKLPDAERVLVEADKKELLTALNQAARGGHVDLVKEFHEEGIPLDGALAFALESGHANVIEYVIQQETDIHAEQKYYPYSMHHFTFLDEPTQLFILNIFIENEFFDEHNREFTHFLLTYTANRGNNLVLNKLIDFELDVMHTHQDPQQNMLKRALWSGEMDTVKIVVEASNGQLIQSPGSKGILVDAVTGNHIEIFDYLLEQGADIHQTNDKGETVLHMAVQQGHAQIAELCLEQKVDINAKREDGTTPLITAMFAGSMELLELLLEHGADTQIQDNQGKTALDYAREFDDQEMIELLLNEN